MKKIGLAGVLLLGLAVIAFLTVTLVRQNETIHEQNLVADQKVQLEKQVKDLKTQLNKFDGVAKADLLKLCTDRANTDYSTYISKNSESVVQGSVTTFFPKSPDVLRTATKNLDTATKDCTEKFTN